MQKRKLDILYCDNYCLAVNKPAGILAQGDRTGDYTIIDMARKRLREDRGGKSGRPFVAPVHRLDRPVSGALLLARKSKAAARLSEAFREGGIEKIYWAFVEGRPAKPSAYIENWLVKDESANRSRIANPDAAGAASAKLFYRTLGKHGGMSLLEVRLLTGRPHQIRVQMAGLGCVIAGDIRYGSKWKLGRMIGLHCRSLNFPHPKTGERVYVCAEVPSEWQNTFFAGGRDPDS